MEHKPTVIEYKCPCCDAPLKFSADAQNMKCEHCDNTFDLDAVEAYNDSLSEKSDAFSWESATQSTWTGEETQTLHAFVCPSCAGELVTDENTVATFCPYCGNPSILPQRISDGLKPEGVIPFSTTKEDAKSAFLRLCKKKPLLPRFFTEEQRVEKITGMYIPFWLYDCESDFRATYKATRVHHWSDSKYDYTRTEHFQLERVAQADFDRIPMDASKKMEDAIMESIEPYNYKALTEFDSAYLSGYLADKYDVLASEGEERIRERVRSTMDEEVQRSIVGYSSVIPVHKNVNIRHGKARYVLLPVWMLSTKYRDKTYLFAMNGQTGKMTGTFPISWKRASLWFGGVFAGASALMALIQLWIF